MIKKKVIISISICLAMGCFLPAIIYFIKFSGNGASSSTADWANFGSYLGGVLTPVIGLGGILAATYVALVAHEIQQQQVKPLANIIFGDYDNIIYVNLKNGGLGPLIVKQLTVHHTVQKKKGNNLINFMPDLPGEKTWKNYCYTLEDKVIPPSGIINLIKITGEMKIKNDADAFQLVRQALSELSITLAYADVFGNQQPSVKRSLAAFGSLNHKKTPIGPVDQ